MYEENMIENPAQIIAFEWSFKFNESHLTEDELKEFNKQCREAGVSPLEVYEYM